MIDRIAKKARSRIGALRRISYHLDSQTMHIMYTSFIRSIMEFGSVAWMGCAQTHLDKLDRVQSSAQKIGGFTVPPLQLRREAAAVSFVLNTLTSMQYFYSIVGPMSVDRLPCTVKSPFKAIRYYLEG